MSGTHRNGPKGKEISYDAQGLTYKRLCRHKLWIKKRWKRLASAEVCVDATIQGFDE